VDLDAFCDQARERHQLLIDEAARSRLRRGSKERPAVPFRGRLALALHRLANRIEPRYAATTVGTLRALAHREIDIDQAMLLLDRKATG
jgi:hypothetical protein